MSVSKATTASPDHHSETCVRTDVSPAARNECVSPARSEGISRTRSVGIGYSHSDADPASRRFNSSHDSSHDQGPALDSLLDALLTAAKRTTGSEFCTFGPCVPLSLEDDPFADSRVRVVLDLYIPAARITGILRSHLLDIAQCAGFEDKRSVPSGRSEGMAYTHGFSHTYGYREGSDRSRSVCRSDSGGSDFGSRS